MSMTRAGPARYLPEGDMAIFRQVAPNNWARVSHSANVKRITVSGVDSARRQCRRRSLHRLNKRNLHDVWARRINHWGKPVVTACVRYVLCGENSGALGPRRVMYPNIDCPNVQIRARFPSNCVGCVRAQRILGCWEDDLERRLGIVIPDTLH
jgi:hypothetical protein